jgi:hypothetical protein
MSRFSQEMASLADIESMVRKIGSRSPRRRFGLAEEGRVFETDSEDAVSF